MSPSSRIPRRRPGFTLTEVVIASSVFLLVSAVTMSLAVTTARTAKTIENQFDSHGALQRAMTRFDTDCSSVGFVQIFRAPGDRTSQTEGDCITFAYLANPEVYANPTLVPQVNRTVTYYYEPGTRLLRRVERIHEPALTLSPSQNLMDIAPVTVGAGTGVTTLYPWVDANAPADAGPSAPLPTHRPLFALNGTTVSFRAATFSHSGYGTKVSTPLCISFNLRS